MTHDDETEILGRPTVKLRYRLQDDESWHERHVEFEEFFGGGAERPEDLFNDVDWVPQHAAVNILDDLEATDVAVTEVVFESDAGEMLAIKETFWNRGHSRFIEITQRLANGETHSEVIFDLRREAGDTYELIRLSRERGAMVPIHHAVSHARPDGSKRDVTLFPTR
jgi:hypothetical protein